MAVTVGGSIVFFVVAGTVQAVLIFWQIVDWPVMVTPPFTGMVIAMAYELSRDTLRVVQLTDDLRESEERMSLAAEAAGFGVWMWTIANNRVWGSERWLRLFGYAPGETVTFEKVVERIHPDDREQVERAMRRAMEDQADYTGQFRLRLPDGTQRWVSVRGRLHPKEAAKPARMLGASMDITECKQAEEKFRLVVEASPNGILLVNDQGRIVLVNAEAERLFGYSREELTGQVIEMLVPERFRGTHPGHRAGFLAAPRARAKDARGELFAVRKDGSEFPVEIRLSPIQTAEGRLVLTAVVDVTARKQAEAEALRQRAELAHITRVSTMGELAASVAHELNQPLGAILANAEAADLFLKQDPPALGELRDILADIRKDDERAGEVIRRMRSLLRKREMEMQPLDLNSVVEDMFRLVSGDAALRKTTLSAELSPRLPAVRGDRIHLQQVLLNLAMNAMEAMARQPPAKRRLVVHTGRVADDTVEVSVTDSGPGIEPTTLPRLFEPFYTTKTNGMGMGLSIARTIIQAHRGRIWAENHAPDGATFRFTLPVASGGNRNQ